MTPLALTPLPRAGPHGLAATARQGRHARGERGSASVQLVVLMPVLFTVMFLGVQAGLYYHARTVAIAAAREGARESGSEHGTAASGLATARDFVGDAGGTDVLPTSRVTARRTLLVATVTVTGTSLSVIPGWHPRVRQSASVPVERLTP